MKQEIFTIEHNEKIAKDIMLMVLSGDTSALTAPGQFVNIQIEGLYLRRPISVCDYSENSLTLIYKIVGEGTEIMSKYKPGVKLDLLVGLGNGFNTEKSGDTPLLIGGGVGVPPMYNLCKVLISQGKKPTVILGFNSREDVFFEEEFKALGANVLITTVDGSYGTRGFVTDAMKDINYSYFFTCGPMPMFKAIEATASGSGQ